MALGAGSIPAVASAAQVRGYRGFERIVSNTFPNSIKDGSLQLTDDGQA